MMLLDTVRRGKAITIHFNECVVFSADGDQRDGQRGRDSTTVWTPALFLLVVCESVLVR